MKNRLLFIILLLSNMMNCYASNGVVLLTMRDKVTVNDSFVKLADVVESFDGDEQLINAIKPIKVMNLGNTVHYKKIDLDVVTNLIYSKIGSVNVVYNGATNTIAKVKTQNFKMNKIIKNISDKISSLIAPITKNYTVKYVSSVRSISIPSGVVSYNYRLPVSVLKKRISVWADISVNSIPYKSLPLWFDIKALSDVAVATTKLVAGENLNLNNLTLEKKDLTLLSEDILKSKDVNNLRVTKRIVPGEVLTHSVLERIPLVSKGQSVKVISSHGNVSIFVKGHALDDGEIGQSIRIRRNGTNRIFNAVVEKQGLVSAVGS